MIWDTNWTKYCQWCIDRGKRCTFAGFADWMEAKRRAA